MKKVIKWSVIFGIICSLLGIGVMTAGAMMGGADNLFDYLSSFFDRGVNSYIESGRISIEEGTDGFGNHSADDIVNDTEQYREQERYENVKELEIEAGPGEIYIVAEERDDPQDTSVRMEYYPVEGVLNYEYIVRQEHEELKIERARQFEHIFSPHREQGDTYDSKRMETLIIYIPVDYQFRKVDIEAAAASVHVEELNADKMDLELMAGALVMEGGRVGKLDAECYAGDMELNLEGSKEQYNYELSSKAGEINLGDESYTSLWNEKSIDYHAGQKMDLDCASGRITVDFYER